MKRPAIDWSRGDEEALTRRALATVAAVKRERLPQRASNGLWLRVERLEGMQQRLSALEEEVKILRALVEQHPNLRWPKDGS